MSIITFFILLAVYTLAMCVCGIFLSIYQRKAASSDADATEKYHKLLIRLMAAYGVIVLLTFAVYALGEQGMYSFHYLAGQGFTYMNLSWLIMSELVLYCLIRILITVIGATKKGSRFADIETRKQVFKKLSWILIAILIVTIVVFLLLKYVI